MWFLLAFLLHSLESIYLIFLPSREKHHYEYLQKQGQMVRLTERRYLDSSDGAQESCGLSYATQPSTP